MSKITLQNIPTMTDVNSVNENKMTDKFKAGDRVVCGGSIHVIAKINVERSHFYGTREILIFTDGGWGLSDNYRYATPLEKLL